MTLDPLPNIYKRLEALERKVEQLQKVQQLGDPKLFDIKPKFQPPNENEVIAYFRENGYGIDLAKRVYKGYNDADWRDSTGKQIKSWKQKCQHVWFKDDNKGITEPPRPNQGEPLPRDYGIPSPTALSREEYLARKNRNHA